MKFNLALVTGASSGIGSDLAKKLSDEGIKLIICGRDKARLQEVHQLVKVDCQIVVADLAKKEGRDLIATIIQSQKPDLVVNNAGAGVYGPAVDLPIDQQNEILELNVGALQELTLVAAKTMKDNGIKGTIINISSTAGFQIMPYFAVYSASKAYVTQFSQCLDFELKPYGIRVLTNCPGMVETHFRERAGGYKGGSRSPLTMTSAFAAEQIWTQIQNGKRLRSFDWKYRFLVFLSRYVIPTSWTAKICGKMIQDITRKASA